MKPFFAMSHVSMTRMTRLLALAISVIVLAACHGSGGGGGPTTPGVSSVNPPNGATNVSKTTVVTATFRDGMDEVDLAANIQAEFTLGDSSGNPISGIASYDDVLNVASLNPDVNLGVLKTYTATLGAGGTITHSGATVMPQFSWSFTTAEGTWGTEENIEMDGATDFSNPHIAVGGNGDAIAVWMEGFYIIHYEKYSNSLGWANNISPPILKGYTSGTGNIVTDLDVAVDGSGNAMAIWVYDAPGAGKHVITSYYNGSSWTTYPALNDSSNNPVSIPKIAFDGSGDAIAVWIENDSIYANRYTGGSWGTTVPIDADLASATNISTTPQLSVFDNGDAIAVWAQYDPVSMYEIIYVSMYSALSNSWTIASSLGNTAAGSIPRIASGASGDAIVSWFQGSGPVNVYAAIFDGSTWTSPSLLDNDAHIGTNVQVGIDSTGNAIALWKADPGNNTPARLRYKVYTAGSVWGALGNIDNGVSDTSEPKLVMDDEGHAIAIWKQYNNNTDMVASTWSNRYRSDTGTWGTAKLLETKDYSNAPTNTITAPIASPNLGMNKYNGNAFAIWLQDQDGAAVNSVWVNHFTN